MPRTSSPKRVTAREAVRALPPKARVLFTQACGTPLGLMQAIANERGHFEDLRMCSGLVFADLPFFPYVGQNISLVLWQISPWTQKLADAGKVELLPVRLSEVATIFSQDGPQPADAVLVQVSPPDSHGFVSLGAAVSAVVDPARQAPIVIAEMNRQCPRTLGNSFLHLSQIDYLVDADYPLIPYRKAEIGDVERSIAGHIADLIVDGATIQTGIGAIPEALMLALTAKKDLGVHSGTIFDGYIPLIEQGVITNARKGIDRHKVVTGELMGGPELCRYVHDNPRIHFDSVRHTHSSQAIQLLDNFVSINSAVEIDLGGQIAAEGIGTRQISGVGGQFDFIQAATLSRGGISIIGLPSTAAKGKISRIVSQLAPGAIVTTPRYFADYVVTEYGAASLAGRTMRQRAEALIAIAHPSFRNILANSLP